MVVIVGEDRVNLRQRQIRMLAVDLLGSPAVRYMIQSDFDNFDPRAINPCDAGGVAVDVGNRFYGKHEENDKMRDASCQRTVS